tara:strand:+ start:494 stop:751 length:258 start_codon:yes stop_codon:yes gene_type:complete
MGNRFYKGDLVRWVVGHETYESDGETLHGTDPIYNHGIVMEVSEVEPTCIIVHSRDAIMAPRLVILNNATDEIQVLSSTEYKHGE